MNQIKTGKFIAETRKAQGLTQKQLADILEISDKTVSKWECGKGLPEVSLMLPLCSALNITVNDLLSGERVSKIEYINKAEENMMNLIKENEENKKRMKGKSDIQSEEKKITGDMLKEQIAKIRNKH